jgi:hypothetical protein
MISAAILPMPVNSASANTSVKVQQDLDTSLDLGHVQNKRRLEAGAQGWWRLYVGP